MSAIQLGNTFRKAFSLGAFLKKYWYWVVLTIVILPILISSIKIAVQDNNPTYPFFLLGSHILNADGVLQKDVNLLKTNPDELVGMPKPTTGIWLRAVYGWKFFRNVIMEITSNVWLIFFPLVLTYKVLRLRNTSTPFQTFFTAAVIFLIYLFVVNSIVLAHGLIVGNTLIPLDGVNEFKDYLAILIYLLPLHGLASLAVILAGMFGA